MAFGWSFYIHTQYRKTPRFETFLYLNELFNIEVFGLPSFLIAISFFHIITQFPFSFRKPISYIVQNLAEMSFSIYLSGTGYTLYLGFRLWDIQRYRNTVYPYVNIVLMGTIKLYIVCSIIEYTRKKLFNLFLYKRKYYYIFRFIDHDFYKKSIPSSII